MSLISFLSKMGDIRKSGTSQYIQDYQQRTLTHETEEIGIATEPCFAHCNEDDRVLIMRPDWGFTEEARNWREHYEFKQCPTCKWLIGKRNTLNKKPW